MQINIFFFSSPAIFSEFLFDPKNRSTLFGPLIAFPVSKPKTGNTV